MLMAITCAFRFEEKPENELVEIIVDGHSTRVCGDCLTLIVVHQRIHHMNIEKLILQIAGP